VKVEFKKSFAKDLKKKSDDRKLLDKVKQIIEHVDHAGDISQISNLKNSKRRATFTASAPVSIALD
jgi:mRNA-degrading endonuclease RelE of RelBE toxin-antitoxin system